MATLAPAPHASLMDGIYRRQRHIYDVTRKYFLFGRDQAIEGLGLLPGASLLEVGCGTGRNLDVAGQRWPGAKLYGVDISAEMLKSAAARLGTRATLMQGDATALDAQNLFGVAQFDRVMISFALSMIPDWRASMAQAADLLAPCGQLHIVDFGDGAGLPGPFHWALRRWLTAFHVTPRHDLPQVAAALVAGRAITVTTRRGPMGYYQIVTLTRQP